MEIRELLENLEHEYPLELQEDWDNSGLQIGNPANELKNVLISLDLEDEGVNKAIAEGANLIITHHPYLFAGTKSIDLADSFYDRLEKVIKNDITVYAMHTNLDIAFNGLNDNLCEILNIKDPSVLEEDKPMGLGRYGKISPTKASDFAELVKEKLDVAGLVCYGDMDKEIFTVGVCGGAGSDLFADALAQGCDLMLTADVKYHEAMDYADKGLVIIDPGHYASENHVVDMLVKLISKMTANKVVTYSKGDNFRTFI